MDRRERAVRKAAREHGLTVEHGGSGHYRLMDGRRLVCSVSKSASDRRSVHNAAAILRRYREER